MINLLKHINFQTKSNMETRSIIENSERQMGKIGGALCQCAKRQFKISKLSDYLSSMHRDTVNSI